MEERRVNRRLSPFAQWNGKKKKTTHTRLLFRPKNKVFVQSVVRSRCTDDWHVMATSAFINSSHIHFWAKAVQESLKVFAFKGFEHIWPFSVTAGFSPPPAWTLATAAL